MYLNRRHRTHLPRSAAATALLVVLCAMAAGCDWLAPRSNPGGRLVPLPGEPTAAQASRLNVARAELLGQPTQAGNAMADYADLVLDIDSVTAEELARLYEQARARPDSITAATEIPVDVELPLRLGMLKREADYTVEPSPRGPLMLVVNGQRLSLTVCEQVGRTGYVAALRLLAAGHGEQAALLLQAVATLGQRLLEGHWDQPQIPAAGLRLCLLACAGLDRVYRPSGNYDRLQAVKRYRDVLAEIYANLRRQTNLPADE
ncbi:MAG: hypothetical protein BIFFINMI_01807 [Phycisphaerae bacterium]|nr:hypothetical protein [Phycisphaerae bacterium]